MAMTTRHVLRIFHIIGMHKINFKPSNISDTLNSVNFHDCSFNEFFKFSDSTSIHSNSTVTMSDCTIRQYRAMFIINIGKF